MIITDMKIARHNIISFLLLSILLVGGLPHPEQSRNKNAHTAKPDQQSCCTDNTSGGNACAIPVANTNIPCKSNCAESGCNCLRRPLNTLSLFTIPDSNEPICTAIFQGIPCTLRQNPQSHIKQPPVPPPLNYS